MSIAYFKRFKMVVGLYDLPPVPLLPLGYLWVPWDEGLIDIHADVQHRCFSDTLDAEVFPCLGDRRGCQLLLREIRRKPGFLAEATWLITGPDGACGTVQGVVDRQRCGGIQNLGIVAGERNHGLGSALLLQALHGFRERGVERAYLEVTADNSAAIRLYQRAGFRRMKTVYKAVTV